jgi:hypothetical protein
MHYTSRHKAEKQLERREISGDDLDAFREKVFPGSSSGRRDYSQLNEKG